MSYYTNQANRLNNLVNDLENKYKKNQINYKNAVKLVKKYHSNINNLASNAKLKHKKLAQLNLAVVKNGKEVINPVRNWKKLLNAAENAVEKAITNPTGANINNAQKKLEIVEKNQTKHENLITNLSQPKGCDDFGFSKAINRNAIMKIYKSSALKYHPNRPGGNANIFKELGRCKEEAIAKLEPIGINNNNNNRNNNNNKNKRSSAAAGGQVVGPLLAPSRKPNNNRSSAMPKITRSFASMIRNQREALTKLSKNAANPFAKPYKKNQAMVVYKSNNNRSSTAAGNNSGQVVRPLAPSRNSNNNNRPSAATGNTRSFANMIREKKNALTNIGKLAANRFTKNNPYKRSTNPNNKNNNRSTNPKPKNNGSSAAAGKMKMSRVAWH